MTATRLKLVISLRDAALAVLRKSGKPRNRPGLSGLEIVQGPPDFVEPPIQMSSRVSLDRGWSLPYGVDVWATLRGKVMKVLNIEWGDGGTILLVSFRRGPWEAELLAMAQPRVQLRLIRGSLH